MVGFRGRERFQPVEYSGNSILLNWIGVQCKHVHTKHIFCLTEWESWPGTLWPSALESVSHPPLCHNTYDLNYANQYANQTWHLGVLYTKSLLGVPQASMLYEVVSDPPPLLRQELGNEIGSFV